MFLMISRESINYHLRFDLLSDSNVLIRYILISNTPLRFDVLSVSKVSMRNLLPFTSVACPVSFNVLVRNLLIYGLVCYLFLRFICVIYSLYLGLMCSLFLLFSWKIYYFPLQFGVLSVSNVLMRYQTPITIRCAVYF